MAKVNGTDRTNDAQDDKDGVERASCGHLVQSNGTCGDGNCTNHGQS